MESKLLIKSYEAKRDSLSLELSDIIDDMTRIHVNYTGSGVSESIVDYAKRIIEINGIIEFIEARLRILNS